jgi:large subunit ribosomal protein L21
MYAVVEIAGKQYKVAPNDKILVPTLKDKAGATVTFDRVLLVGGDDGTKVGHPVVAGVRVSATVMENVKGDKVTVFKKKKRKGYRLKRGHRQEYTEVQITNIGK